MKKSNFILLLIALLTLSSCGKKAVNEFDHVAEIIGIDFTLCPCCGGPILDSGNESLQYRIQEMPEDLDALIEQQEFPITINVNYTILDSCVQFRFLRIDDFELIK